MGSARVVCLNVGQAAVSVQATCPRYLPETLQPTSVLSEVAEAIGKTKPAGREHTYDHMTARRASLAVSMVEDVDVQPIRSLIARLVQA